MSIGSPDAFWKAYYERRSMEQEEAKKHAPLKGDEAKAYRMKMRPLLNAFSKAVTAEFEAVDRDLGPAMAEGRYYRFRDACGFMAFHYEPSARVVAARLELALAKARVKEAEIQGQPARLDPWDPGFDEEMDEMERKGLR